MNPSIMPNPVIFAIPILILFLFALLETDEPDTCPVENAQTETCPVNP